MVIWTIAFTKVCRCTSYMFVEVSKRYIHKTLAAATGWCGRDTWLHGMDGTCCPLSCVAQTWRTDVVSSLMPRIKAPKGCLVDSLSPNLKVRFLQVWDRTFLGIPSHLLGNMAKKGCFTATISTMDDLRYPQRRKITRLDLFSDKLINIQTPTFIIFIHISS